MIIIIMMIITIMMIIVVMTTIIIIRISDKVYNYNNSHHKYYHNINQIAQIVLTLIVIIMMSVKNQISMRITDRNIISLHSKIKIARLQVLKFPKEITVGWVECCVWWGSQRRSQNIPLQEQHKLKRRVHSRLEKWGKKEWER